MHDNGVGLHTGRRGSAGIGRDRPQFILTSPSSHTHDSALLPQDELQRLHQMALPRLAPWAQAQARALDGRVSELRAELRTAEETWEKQGAGTQV